MVLTVLRKVLEVIRGVPWFSIVANEGSDVANKEQLLVCIHWVDNDFQIHEDLVELINVLKTDAVTLTSAIKDCLI